MDTTHHNDVIAEGEVKLFRALWKDSYDNIFIVMRDSSGQYVSEKSNRSQEKTFHLKPNQLDGCLLSDVVDAETYRHIAARYDDCLNQNQPISYEECHEIDNTGPRYWNTLILPVVDEQTGVERIFGISREITALKEAEKVLKRANFNLEVEVAKRTQELREALKEMERISVLDKLTGLYNRHKLDEVLLNQKHLAERYGDRFGVIILDLDDFKEINDSLGHHYGDRALEELASILKRCCRKTDILGRWGGDEFLLIVPHATQDSITGLASHLKNEIENHHFADFKPLTSSFGVAIYQSDDTVDSLIIRADRALYQSKSKGKNFVAYQAS